MLLFIGVKLEVFTRFLDSIMISVLALIKINSFLN